MLIKYIVFILRVDSAFSIAGNIVAIAHLIDETPNTKDGNTIDLSYFSGLEPESKTSIRQCLQFVS